MKFYDFGGAFAETYSGTCECGNKIEVSTQRDEEPEYYTKVFVRCQCCGRSVKFTLPVN